MSLAIASVVLVINSFFYTPFNAHLSPPRIPDLVAGPLISPTARSSHKPVTYSDELCIKRELDRRIN